MMRDRLRAAVARYAPDGYSVALVGMVALASVLPLRGGIAAGFGVATNVAIALLFFLHGARLPREAVIAGVTHWRLHLVVLCATFVLFPVLGVVTQPIVALILAPPLALGVLFVCLLSSTVQSSIAFTSIAGGNVAAAVCSASASNLLGIVLTPLLASLLISGQGVVVSVDEIGAIVVQLLLPFLAGQVMRRWIGDWLARHKKLIGFVDRGSILMVVYGAFSAAVSHGLWRQLSITTLVELLLIEAVMLGIVLAATTWGSRWLGFGHEDEIAIVFCGSKKSLASGVPIASVLFPAASVGLIVLPLMLFHQIQLMACAALARRYAWRKSRAAPVMTSGTSGSVEVVS
ncbi:MAG: bile acid:sodium symporter [Azospirillaceae bacterium]|nr:bile acid:sodium symporter [Azospirillaceae bacterium]